MSAEIISMATRQVIEPGEPVEFSDINLEELFDAPEQVESPVTKDLLAKIDRLRVLVEKGRVTTMTIVGQDNATGYFMTEFVTDTELDRCELFGLIGVLESLKAEIIDLAMMAPTVNLDGDVIDPHLEEETA